VRRGRCCGVLVKVEVFGRKEIILGEDGLEKARGFVWLSFHGTRLNKLEV
jgi:hypothetical protein